MSVLQVLLGSLYPIGAIAQGAIADVIGLRETTALAALLMLALLIGARVAWPRFAEAIDAPVAELHGEASGSVEAP
jgi:hypothetical protein